jgi:signal transduction histidine kinase
LTALTQRPGLLDHGDPARPGVAAAAGRTAAIADFIRDGLRRGERCLCATSPAGTRRIRLALAAVGVDAEAERRWGGLEFLGRRPPKPASKTLAPRAVAERLDLARGRALADGFSGLRSVLQMDWLLGPRIDPETMAAWEVALAGLPADGGLRLLCDPGPGGALRQLAPAPDPRAASAAADMIGDLTSSIAHQIKQPLAAVATNADAALRWLDRDPPNLEEARRGLERIARDGRRAAAAVDAIRALFAGTGEGRRLLDLAQVARETTFAVGGALRDHEVSLNWAISPSLAPVSGDREQLQQCLLNLISNAVEAMAPTPEQHRRLDISARMDEAGCVLLELTDTGPGLDPRVADTLFDAFVTTKPDGAGLGLAICRKIAESHGGQLSAGSASDAGARFSLRLPAARAA